ncbi:exonuclease/endonuclease/phosphatase family protein [Roseimaritima sediminicola]|uniref:deoxyribonuclease I n=1 Tax=Roseimaritima sediminicola TaxID=2662066 RepID=UPI0012983596|nr:deoxyribonuclease I [Roseimaritima sediminicola]
MRTALLLIVLVAGGWYFFRNYEIGGLDAVELRPRQASGPSERDADDDLRGFLTTDNGAVLGNWSTTDGWTGSAAAGEHLAAESSGVAADGPAAGRTDAQAVSFFRFGASAPEQDADRTAAPAPEDPALVHPDRRIRVASWALGGFGKDKLAKSHVMGWLARVVRTFDVIAIQQVHGTQRDLVPRIVEHVNRTGRKYDFLLAPPRRIPSRLGSDQEQLAILFDTERVVTDRSQFYTVADPQNVLRHDPIVAWFRAIGPSPERAWTFSVVNVRVEMDAARQEVAALRGVMQAVTEDGRHEDDTLMVGLFQADDAYLVPSLNEARTVAAVQATPTDIFGRHQVSNILVDGVATTEYLGSGGVLNYLRMQNLTLAECEELSPHFPVYAEFSPLEGL